MYVHAHTHTLRKKVLINQATSASLSTSESYGRKTKDAGNRAYAGCRKSGNRGGSSGSSSGGGGSSSSSSSNNNNSSSNSNGSSSSGSGSGGNNSSSSGSSSEKPSCLRACKEAINITRWLYIARYESTIGGRGRHRGMRRGGGGWMGG